MSTTRDPAVAVAFQYGDATVYIHNDTPSVVFEIESETRGDAGGTAMTVNPPAARMIAAALLDAADAAEEEVI